jgi:hypothetical protein
MENECYFVSCRGILKSCTFHYINQTTNVSTDVNYLYDMLTSNEMFDGMSIYIFSDLIKYFVNIILPNIKYKFVLVTGESNLCVPKEVLTEQETYTLIKNPYLLKWFVQNSRIHENDKIIQMPIGLDYHTFYNNPNNIFKLPEESHIPKNQELVLLSIINDSIPYYKRIPKIFVNFSLNDDRFQQKRKALNIISKELLILNKDILPRSIYLEKAVNYTFVLTPSSSGLDSHKIWEALCIGCIPILCVPEFKKLLEDLPVLIVEDWSELTQELLNKTIEEFRSRIFNYRKLTLDYWKGLINENINKQKSLEINYA